MALGTFAPGYYTCTYDGNDLGLVEGVRRLRRRHRAQPIAADKYGDSMIDGVYRGGDCFLQMTFKEWTSAVRSALWPFDADFGDMGQCGRLLSDLAKSLVLTVEANSPAATAGPSTVTASKVILAPENDVEIIFGNEQRDVPVLLQLLPYDYSGGRIVWFTVTNPA